VNDFSAKSDHRCAIKTF